MILKWKKELWLILFTGNNSSLLPANLFCLYMGFKIQLVMIRNLTISFFLHLNDSIIPDKLFLSGIMSSNYF